MNISDNLQTVPDFPNEELSAGPCGTGGAQEATPRNQGPKEAGGDNFEASHEKSMDISNGKCSVMLNF